MTQNLNKSIALLAVMVMTVAAVAAVMPFSDSVDAAEQEYDVDMGKFYSMQTQLIWNGKDAERVHYEFSDGTSSDEWNPLKTWSEPGVYYITQTAYNSYQGGSETTTVYKVEIMGYPEIHFEENGGSDVQDIEQTAFNVTADRPGDPVRDSYTFTGWFTDEDCTEAFDWTQGLKKDITLYAGWESTGETPVGPGGDDTDEPEDPTDTEEPETPSEPEDGFHFELWMIIVIVIVIIAIALYLWRR